MTDESNRPSPSVPLSAASLPPLADLEARTMRPERDLAEDAGFPHSPARCSTPTAKKRPAAAAALASARRKEARDVMSYVGSAQVKKCFFEDDVWAGHAAKEALAFFGRRGELPVHLRSRF